MGGPSYSGRAFTGSTMSTDPNWTPDPEQVMRDAQAYCEPENKAVATLLAGIWRELIATRQEIKDLKEAISAKGP